MKKRINNLGPAIHVGSIIKTHLDNKRIRKGVMCRLLEIDDSQLVVHQRNASIQTYMLTLICHSLKHNFFADIAAQFPATYTSNAPVDISKDERIASLEKENELLKEKVKMLMEILK